MKDILFNIRNNTRVKRTRIQHALIVARYDYTSSKYCTLVYETIDNTGEYGGGILLTHI